MREWLLRRVALFLEGVEERCTYISKRVLGAQVWSPLLTIKILVIMTVFEEAVAIFREVFFRRVDCAYLAKVTEAYVLYFSFLYAIILTVSLAKY